MSALFDMLVKSIGTDQIERMSRNIGADAQSTSALVSNALPLMVKAMAQNARDPQNAASLMKALERDHDGSILDNLDNFLDKGPSSSDGKILDHLFPASRERVEQGLGAVSGIDASAVSSLLPMLAPLVMGMLGKATKGRNLDASGLSGLLQEEEREAERKAPTDLGMLGSLLDADGDGQIIDDLGRMGASLLGKFFGSR